MHRILRVASLATALTVACSGATLIPASAIPAPAQVGAVTSASAPTPSAVPAARWPKPVPSGNVTSRVDVDGDGRPDTTTFRFVSSNGQRASYQLAMRTARGKTASLRILTDDLADQPASDFWIGATGIDGIRGNEIVLDLVGGVGDATDIRTYAWRNGKIVLVPAAGSSARWPDWHQMWVQYNAATGYTFSQDRKGVRYVVKHDVKGSASGRTFTGTKTTYRWLNTGWKALKVERISVSRKVADSFTGLNGLIWR